MGNFHFSVKPTVADVGLANWSPQMIKAAIARLEDIQMKASDSFGWTVNRATFQTILQITESKMDRVWELCADGKDTCSVMNVIFGLIFFSAVKFRAKVNMLFSFLRTRFEKVLTPKQVTILLDTAAQSSFTFFDITLDQKLATLEEILEATSILRESIEKQFGLRELLQEELLNWVEDKEFAVSILTALGTTDIKKTINRLQHKWDEKRQARFEMSIMKLTTCSLSMKCPNPGLKAKRKFLPTNRKSIEHVLDNIEIFLPESYKIQRCYRAKSVFKSNHIIELKRNFDLLDTDKSGTLTVAEFCTGFESIRATVKRIFARAKGKDDSLSFKEFLEVLYPDTFPEEREMMQALVMPAPQPANMAILDLAALFRAIENLKEDKAKHRGKIQLSEIIAVVARTNELYPLVIKWSRFERSRWDYMVTFEDFLSRLFPSFTQKEIRKMAVWSHSPPVPKLSQENELEIQTQFMRWDKDGSGAITFDELNAFLKDNDIDISRRILKVNFH